MRQGHPLRNRGSRTAAPRYLPAAVYVHVQSELSFIFQSTLKWILGYLKLGCVQCGAELRGRLERGV